MDVEYLLQLIQQMQFTPYTPDDEARIQAIIETIQASPSGKQALIATLSADAPNLVLRGLDLLRQIRVDETIPTLEALLDSEESFVASNAMVVLATYHQRQILPRILDALTHERSWNREDAVWSLWLMNDETLLPFIIWALDDEVVEVWDVALDALKLAGDRAVPYLVEAIEKGLILDVRHAFYSLGEIDTEESRAALKRFTDSDRPEVAESARFQLQLLTGTPPGRIGAPRGMIRRR